VSWENSARFGRYGKRHSVWFRNWEAKFALKRTLTGGLVMDAVHLEVDPGGTGQKLARAGSLLSPESLRESRHRCQLPKPLSANLRWPDRGGGY
jgi:hypothetical protein